MTPTLLVMSGAFPMSLTRNDGLGLVTGGPILLIWYLVLSTSCGSLAATSVPTSTGSLILLTLLGYDATPAHHHG